MTYDFAKPKDLAAVASLLELCKLPTNDLEAHDFIVALDENRVVGCVGIELDGPLLRSLAVDPASRGKGIANELCSRLLQHAESHGIQEIYLLTDSAERFFERIGFEKVSRENAPEWIQKHKQFTTLCPSTAVVMHKRLDAG
jgi:amino-acid N-acetyltransferase